MANEQVHPVMRQALQSVGDVIGEALRPARTILDELVERRRELWVERDEVEAQIHEIQAEIEKLTPTGEDSAEWHRLAAISLRTRTPEAEQAADRAWRVIMARSHLRRGSVPAAGDHRAAEIAETMDELREEPTRNCPGTRP